MFVVPFWNQRTNEETSLGRAGPKAVDMQFNTLKNLKVLQCVPRDAFDLAVELQSRDVSELQ
jgi:hypothetical protein